MIVQFDLHRADAAGVRHINRDQAIRCQGRACDHYRAVEFDAAHRGAGTVIRQQAHIDGAGILGGGTRIIGRHNADDVVAIGQAGERPADVIRRTGGRADSDVIRIKIYPRYADRIGRGN